MKGKDIIILKVILISELWRLFESVFGAGT